MDKINSFWAKVENFILSTPKIIIWMIFIGGCCIPNTIGCFLVLIALLILLYKKD
mgnify:CR=1 FL=1